MAAVDLSSAKVLVTGGGGFVGVPTVRALAEAGARVRVLDVADSPRLSGIECDLQVGDIADEGVVAAACADVDYVIHLAVLPLTQANAEVSLAFETNIRGSFNVFRAAGEAGVRKIIYSSASSAYGPTQAVPISEDHPLRPSVFYAASKAASEMVLRGLAGNCGFGYCILRYMNVYGPGQRAGVVPAIARRLLAGERPILNGDGEQAFDFVHIDDCAGANLSALISDANGEDFNVGCGEATSLNALVALMNQLLATELAPTYQGDPTPAPPRVGRIEKLRDLAGFEARVALRDGLAGVLDELRNAEFASAR